MRLLNRAFSAVNGVSICLQLWLNHNGDLVSLLGLLSSKVRLGLGQHIPQLFGARTLLSVQRPGGFLDGLFGFRPPHDNFRSSLLGLAIELFTLS